MKGNEVIWARYMKNNGEKITVQAQANKRNTFLFRNNLC